MNQVNAPSKRSVKHDNRKNILDYLRASGEVSISDIAGNANVSKPTAKKVVDYYIENNLVKETGKGSSTEEGGKKPSLFSFNKEFGFVIAVHLGPDFLYAAVMDMNVDIRHSYHEVIPKLAADETVELMVSKVREFLQLDWSKDKTLVNIVIGLPGVVDPATGVSVFTPHYPKWGTEYPFRDVFVNKLGTEVPVHLDCVNRYQAIAEMMKGQARGVKDFMIIDAMEEGVGAGVVANYSVKHGFHNLSGEIGHMILQADGPECICGGKGCFEAMVSVNRVINILKDGYSGHKDSLIYRTSDQPDVGIDDLFEAASGGDELAVEVLDQIASWFAIGLNNVIMVYDPQLIVIQGIYAKAGEIFLRNLRAKINKVSFPRLQRNVKLVYSELGRERGVLGAGCYGVWHSFQNPRLYAHPVDTRKNPA